MHMLLLNTPVIPIKYSIFMIKNLKSQNQLVIIKIQITKLTNMFDDIDLFSKRLQPQQYEIDEYWENITPKKKRKLIRENSTRQIDDPVLNLTRKKSMLDDLQFIAPLRKDSSFMHPRNHKHHQFGVSEWASEMDIFSSNLYGKNNNNEHEMEEEEYEEIEPLSRKLNKKMTMIDQNIDCSGLKLYKNNSTIEIDHEASKTDDIKYGDNIFIQQINTLERGLSRKQSYIGNKYKANNYECEEDDTERLLRDYEITSNLNAYIKHHENFLCLNKLQRIFYYVKKITFSNQFQEEEVHDLSSQQIRTYNKDQDGRLLRFYQSWMEQESIYLIFETAKFSLVQKTTMSVRMRENQVWSMLNDCCQALLWMKNSLNEYHLNIKPGNILKCRDRYKLSDPLINNFHLITVLSLLEKQENSQDYVKMAMAYAAPQIIKYRKLLGGLDLHKCDIYSLGISILENITGIPVSILIKNLKSIRKNIERFMKSYSPALQSLLLKMVHSEPTKRPAANQISFLQDLDNILENKKNAKEQDKKRKLSL